MKARLVIDMQHSTARHLTVRPTSRLADNVTLDACHFINRPVVSYCHDAMAMAKTVSPKALFTQKT